MELSWISQPIWLHSAVQISYLQNLVHTDSCYMYMKWCSKALIDAWTFPLALAVRCTVLQEFQFRVEVDPRCQK